MKRCKVGNCYGRNINNWLASQNSGGGSGGGEPVLGYGLLYNWYAAADERGVAPDGFRFPSRSDYIALGEELGGTVTGGQVTSAGGFMKSDRLVSDGHPYWSAPNSGATNSSNLSFFPSGLRSGFNGSYSGFQTTSSNYTTDNGIFGGKKTAGLSANNDDLGLANEGNSSLKTGASIRCVSDTEPATPTVQDADGNSYTWVQIGSQYWLQQSLKTTSYNNGDPIATGLDNTAWANTTDGAWAYPNGDSSLPI